MNSIIPESPINKTMDRADLDRPDCRVVVQELFGLMRRMQAAGVSYSSWYGTLVGWPSVWEWINRAEDYHPLPGNPDELRIPWFLIWEIAWVVCHTPLRAGSRVLDMGGAASLFACYLASRGHDVTAIDLNPALVEQTERIARTMKWRLSARRMDMQELDFPDGRFANVFSLCVFEHLPVTGRIECSRRIRSVLEPGGTASFTFDYANPQAFARIGSPGEVEEQLVHPSGLALRGVPFRDNRLRYLDAPPYFGFSKFTRLAARLHGRLRGTLAPGRFSDRHRRYTFGAIFLEKTD